MNTAVIIRGGPDSVFIARRNQPVITLPSTSCVLTSSADGPAVIMAGQRGPTGIGIPGPAGGSAVQRIAGVTLSALKVVYELNGQVFPLDYRDEDHIDLILGITLTAAGTGQQLNVQLIGALDDSGWSWIPGRLWLGANGSLTQSPPEDGFDVLVGAATSATRITLNLQDAIELE